MRRCYAILKPEVTRHERYEKGRDGLGYLDGVRIGGYLGVSDLSVNIAGTTIPDTVAPFLAEVFYEDWFHGKAPLAEGVYKAKGTTVWIVQHEHQWQMEIAGPGLPVVLEVTAAVANHLPEKVKLAP